ncbi:MAG TPA: CbtB-domain containing protein [Pseudonocardiaceae bacterium]
MSSVSASSPIPGADVINEALSSTKVIVLLGVTVFLALAVYYFIGVDEGMVSVFGNSMVVHEWVHDARHFLGFPCH